MTDRTDALPPGVVFVSLQRPEGYEDVHPDLLIEDAGINPAFRPEDATDTVRRLHAEVARLEASSIHSCGPDCSRLPCVQRREIEALRAERDAEQARGDMYASLVRRTTEVLGLTSEWHTMPERVGALVAERDALRADAERYRWLAAHARSTSEHWGGRWSLIVDGPAPTRHDCEDALDAAIDAARAPADFARLIESTRQLRPGEPCPDCDGTGECGGMSTGGNMWRCERCGGSGAGAAQGAGDA